MLSLSICANASFCDGNCDVALMVCIYSWNSACERPAACILLTNTSKSVYFLSWAANDILNDASMRMIIIRINKKNNNIVRN